MSSHALGTADDRAKVVRVGNTVRDNDQRWLSPFLGNAEDIVHVAIFLLGRHSHHTLMGCATRHRVKLCLFHLDNGDAVLDSFCHDNHDRALALSSLNEYLVHRSSRFEKLADGISAHYKTFGIDLLRVFLAVIGSAVAAGVFISLFAK